MVSIILTHSWLAEALDKGWMRQPRLDFEFLTFCPFHASGAIFSNTDAGLLRVELMYMNTHVHDTVRNRTVRQTDAPKVSNTETARGHNRCFARSLSAFSALLLAHFEKQFCS